MNYVAVSENNIVYHSVSLIPMNYGWLTWFPSAGIPHWPTHMGFLGCLEPKSTGLPHGRGCDGQKEVLRCGRDVTQKEGDVFSKRLERCWKSSPTESGPWSPVRAQYTK